MTLFFIYNLVNAFIFGEPVIENFILEEMKELIMVYFYLKSKQKLKKKYYRIYKSTWLKLKDFSF